MMIVFYTEVMLLTLCIHSAMLNSILKPLTGQQARERGCNENYLHFLFLIYV